MSLRVDCEVEDRGSALLLSGAASFPGQGHKIDNNIRILTRDSSRLAPADQLTAFEEELASMEHSNKEVLEGVKTEDLPTDSALYVPGEKDGQTKIIRKDGKVEVYNWSALETQWKKIGDVVGSSGGSEKTSGRTLHQGKEYDFVFSVDFDETKPPVKLPYNRSDDPYVVAQKFLEDNDLPQSYLDTVAKFIMQNVPGAGAAAPVSAYADPFTGGGRYIPGGGMPAKNAGGGGGAAGYRDPFTGGSAYVSGGASDSTPRNGAGAAGESSANTFYPLREYLGFHLVNVDGVLKKLKENMGATAHELSEEDLVQFRKLMQKDLSTEAVSLSTLNTLGKTLDLSEAKIFPALDLLRLAIRHPAVCDYFCGAERSAFFLDFILPLIRSNKLPANQQLTLKMLTNIFLGGAVGVEMLSRNAKAILGAVTEAAGTSTEKQVQIARATLLLNYTILAAASQSPESKLELLYVVMEVAKAGGEAVVRDDEAVFRLMVALGTLLAGSGEEIKGYAKALDLVPLGMTVASVSTDERIKAVWRSLERDLS